MRLPIEWIKEHVTIDSGADEIADRLTMAGLEVEEKAESAIGPVLDIKVTPNRGDCLSVRGVARELRAAYRVGETGTAQGASINQSVISDQSGEIQNPKSKIQNPQTRVSISAPDLCPRYAARVVKNLKVGPSPRWMQDRLTAAGMRPINNIVDVTNYVMLETGQPLHAFDYDTLKENRIVVRRAAQGETLTTLDGQERALTSDMLVIADAERAVALAGVMGGAETEMTERTTTLLLESAHFEPLAVRRSARALGMRTEASYRFERFVDPAGVAAAANRACELIAELGAGDPVEGVADEVARPTEVRTLLLRIGRVSEMLGYEVEPEEAVGALTSLGFESDWTFHTPYSTAVTFSIPTWRPDIVREIDLVEEVGRVLGYERIPETLPAGRSLQGADNPDSRFAEQIRDLLAGAGLQEVVTHSLLAESALEQRKSPDLRVAIRSALSAELSGLRRSLLPGLVDALDRNARRGQTPLAFFEVGHVFRVEGSEYVEESAVAAVIAGPLVSTHWHKDARGPASDYFTVRGLVEALAAGLHVDSLSFTSSRDPRFHPGRSADLLVDGQVIGHAGELHPRCAADLTTRHRVVAFELRAAPLQSDAAGKSAFEPLTPYPAVTRDLAPRLAGDVSYRAVERAVASAKVSHLERLALTDLFAGTPLPEGMKSLTLSLTFRASDRTLTDDEVNGALAEIRGALERECGATFVA